MEEHPAVELARTWRVQLFGGRSPYRIEDPIVEPLWDGPRLLAVVENGRATLFHEGSPLPGQEEVLAALVAATTSSALIAEGHLTPEAFRTGEGATVEPEHHTPGIMSRLFGSFGSLGGGRRESSLRRREEAARLAQRDQRVLSGSVGRLAFVATDLLWLDGEELLDIPLLERKRLLESALGESELIRRSAFVRPSATGSLVGWKSLGFTILAWKAANSRYRPGTRNDAWAAAPVRGGVASPGGV